MRCKARYFDGESAADQPVELQLLGHRLSCEVGAERRSWPLEKVAVVPPVGAADWVIELPEGGRLLFNDERLAEAIAPPSVGRFVRFLENSWRWAVAALVVAVFTTWGLLTWGVPSLSRQVAFAVPTSIERTISEDGLGLLDEIMFEPSELEQGKKDRLQEIFQDIIADVDDDIAFRLEFRASPAIGPNAFAVPGGLVVMTDEMVELAQSYDELRAVLAHEVGHQVQRHSLRILLQNSLSALLIAGMTGDVASLTALSATVPTVLMQTKYSRDFEREADDYAFAHLNAREIDTDVLSELLLRLEAEAGVEAGDESLPSSWLSTHPRSKDRVEPQSD